jgi:hypothetical protein
MFQSDDPVRGQVITISRNISILRESRAPMSTLVKIALQEFPLAIGSHQGEKASCNTAQYCAWISILGIQHGDVLHFYLHQFSMQSGIYAPEQCINSRTLNGSPGSSFAIPTSM